MSGYVYMDAERRKRADARALVACSIVVGVAFLWALNYAMENSPLLR